MTNRDNTQSKSDLRLIVRYSPTPAPGDPGYSLELGLQCEPAGYIPRLPEDQWQELSGLGANAVMFYPTIPDDELLEELIQSGYYIFYGSHWVPSQFRALYGMEEGDGKLLDHLRDWNRKYPGRVWWGCSCESGIDKPDVRWAIGFPEPGTPTCKTEAYERTRAYYLEQSMANTPYWHFFYSQKRLQNPPELRHMLFESWRAAGCPHLEGLKPWGFGEVMEHARETGADLDEYNLVVGDGMHSHMLHCFRSFGASQIFSEFNCSCPPAQPTMAFLRGAARAADVPSFIHWSAWGGNDGSAQSYDENGRIKTGYSPSMQLRQWVFGWLAGIHSMTIFEDAGTQAWYHDQDGKRHLSPSAQNFARLSQLALHEGLPGLPPAKPVEPCAPFALMLERHHGFTPGRDDIWWGTVPWSRDEDNIQAFLDAAWPSHQWFLGGRKREEWRKEPWSDTAEYFRLRSEGLEAEDFEKGLMSDTPWGDTFDAITEDAGPELLARYKVILLLGGIRLGAELRMRLKDYVEAGGIVVVNAPHAVRNSEKWLGIELSQWHPSTRNDGLPFNVSLADAEAVNVIVPRPIQTEAGREHPAPLLSPTMLTRVKRGKGEVYLTMLDYSAEGAMDLYRPFLDGLFGRFLPVRLESEQKDGVGWMLNPLPKGWLLTVMNHGWNYWECDDPNAWKSARPSQPWHSTAFFPETESPKNPIATDLWTGSSLPLTKCDGGWRVDIDVPPYGFVMCSLVGEDK